MSESNRWLLEQSILHALPNRAARAAFAADPAPALAEHGVTVPEGVSVTALVDTPQRMHVVVPFAGHAFLGSLDVHPGLRGTKALVSAVGARALEDEAFLAGLREDATGMAQAAVKSLRAVKGLEVTVHEEDASTVFITMPYEGRHRVNRR